MVQELSSNVKFYTQLGGQLDNRRSTILVSAVIAVLIIILAGLTWTNYQYSTQNPGGSDFLSRWVGTRAFITRGWSPYSEQTSLEIQNTFYGRPARPYEDQILFVYPFYTILLVAPYALIEDYGIARAFWMTTLEVSLLLMVIVTINFTRWKTPRWLLILIFIFSLIWYHAVRPVINGNPSVLIALFVSLAFLSIRNEHDGLAGFLLALTTIKPQIIILLLPFVILWAVSHRRWELFWSFVGSLAILIASTSLLIPDWVIQNLRQVLSYPIYTLPGTPGAIFAEWLPGIGNQIGWLLTAILVVILIWEWRSALKKEFRWFLWTACLTLVITNLIGIRTATANFIVMFPALILIFSLWDKRWGRTGRILILASIALLFFGLWWLFLNTLQVSDQPIQNPVMFFPLPVLLLIGLYWVRWQVIRSPAPILDKYRSFNNTGNM